MGWLTAHIAWCHERNLRPQTIEGKRNILRRYARALERDDPTHATAVDTREWWAGRQRMQPQTRATELANVRGFYQWAIFEGIRDDDPTARLQRPRLRRGLPRPISERDLAFALIRPPERIAAWLYLGAYAGLRVGEMAALRGEHIVDIEDGRGILVVDGKSIEQRIVPMHPFVEQALPPIRRGWMFPANTDIGRVKAWTVSHKIASYLHDLDIEATGHSLRHRFLTQLYQQTHDLRMCQDVAGHASPDTTARYTKWAPATASAAILGLA